MTIDAVRDRFNFYTVGGKISGEDLWLLATDLAMLGQLNLSKVLEDYDLTREHLGYPAVDIWTLIERHYEDEQVAA